MFVRLNPWISRSLFLTSLVLSTQVLAEEGLMPLKMEEQVDFNVTSVAKKEQNSKNVATAIYVITQEDIKRTGVTTIAEALRLAPGVHVARVDSNKWAVGIRGNLGRFSNKLLVLMDGRTLYTQSFSGVYWEVQDIILDDIERIEVIRGPGATVWGANAVNGVINIITKHSSDTQGLLVNVGGGDYEKAFADIRYGAELSYNAQIRGYIKYFKRNSLEFANRQDARDDWKMGKAGFRFDWQMQEDENLTIQGDMYSGDINSQVTTPALAPPYLIISNNDISPYGANLLAKWDKDLSENSHLMMQLYYDKFERKEFFVDQMQRTIDFEANWRYLLSERHDLIMGLGMRHISDEYRHTLIISGARPKRNDYLYTGFIQDDITIIKDKLHLVIGSKFEHNNYTGVEVHPSARFTYTLDNDSTVWGAISRAVRTPCRAEHDGVILSRVIPPPIMVTAIYENGVGTFDSEKLNAYELGYRFMPFDKTYIDMTAFYHDYDKLRTSERPVLPFLQNGILVLPTYYGNLMEGHSYGFEFSALSELTDFWKLKFAFTGLKQNFKNKSGSTDLNANLIERDTPKYNWNILSTFNLNPDWDFDVWFKYVDSTGWSGLGSVYAQRVKSYFTMDARVAWRPKNKIELSLVGQNLLDSPHLEAVQEGYTQPTYVTRSFYLKAKVEY